MCDGNTLTQNQCSLSVLDKALSLPPLLPYIVQHSTAQERAFPESASITSYTAVLTDLILSCPQPFPRSNDATPTILNLLHQHHHNCYFYLTCTPPSACQVVSRITWHDLQTVAICLQTQLQHLPLLCRTSSPSRILPTYSSTFGLGARFLTKRTFPLYLPYLEVTYHPPYFSRSWVVLRLASSVTSTNQTNSGLHSITLPPLHSCLFPPPTTQHTPKAQLLCEEEQLHHSSPIITTFLWDP